MEQTLVLNATFEPLKIVSWQRAMTLFVQGKAEVLEEHEREARSVSFTFRLPSVVRLLRFVRVRQKADYVPFTRANIYSRDDYTCQYCGEPFEPEDLTFDHVVPAAQGGRRSWENIVTACVPCNKRKAARTPEQAGMHLIRPAKKPSSTPALRVTVGLRRNTPDSWRSYLYWNVEMVDE